MKSVMKVAVLTRKDGVALYINASAVTEFYPVSANSHLGEKAHTAVVLSNGGVERVLETPQQIIEVLSKLSEMD